MDKETVETVVSVTRKRWLRITTKLIRMHALDDVFPGDKPGKAMVL